MTTKMYSYKRERAKRLYPEPAIFNKKDGVFYVHYFVPNDPLNDPYRRTILHGKSIPPTTLLRSITLREGFEPPDPALAAWHYAQSVMARIRGFSIGLEK